MAVVLVGATLSFAQVQPKVVVTPPAGCRVVVAGYGGTLWAPAVGAVPENPGKVGAGGTVVMPDPFDQTTTAGNFSCTTILDATTTVPVTLTSWNLNGDLSFQTSTTSGSALQSVTYPLTPATTSATRNIQSYNKTLRSPSESQTPSTPNLARSRGTVSISFVNGACGGGISFDVYKTYGLSTATYLPPIIGPSCVKPDTTYTYSVDQIASDNLNTTSPDEYYWSFSGISVINSYTSADKSSITFTTTTLPTTPFSINCCYGRANQWDGENGGSHKTCVSLPLKVTPIKPSFTPALNELPAQNNCIATGTTTPVNYSITNNTTYTYGWTSTNPTWIMSQSLLGTTRTFTINFSGDNNPGKVTLKINSTCDPVEFNYQINRTLATTLGITAVGGTAPVTCLTAATSYSLPLNALGNFTTWKIDTIPPLVAPATLPVGAPTVTNTGTPNSTTLVTPGTASGQFSLVATSNSATTCTSTNTRITINIPLSKPLFTATTPACVLKGVQITTIAVTPVSGATSYTWTLPTGWSFPVGSTTNTTANPTFIVATTATGALGTLSVVANNGTTGCNSLAATQNISYIAVTLTPNPLLDAPDQYFVNSCGGFARWYLSGSTTPLANPAPPLSNYSITGSAGNTLLLTGNAAPPTGVCANVYSDAAYTNLVATVCAPTVGTHSLRQGTYTTIIDTQEIIEGISIFPNPNNGVFFVKVENVKESATAILNDFSGKEVATYNLKKGTNKLGNEELPKGTYILVLKVDGKQETRQVIIK